jgi:hypothetical protein
MNVIADYYPKGAEVPAEAPRINEDYIPAEKIEAHITPELTVEVTPVVEETPVVDMFPVGVDIPDIVEEEKLVEYEPKPKVKKGKKE